ncbi:hypothetical protein OsI_29893 [Oryza sativa Indica Group]|uniref:Uncharacterized protein n=1 Tax=Oryza sativa subsp. indica TaxID=39946 RepID=B8B8W7_ORYSI|nr:hypothetical protein OsI_29893 [Oryza sativa Indica Group]
MAASCSFTISNHCAQTIWPATLAGAGTPQLATTGFRLDPGQSVQVPAPAGWSGRIWARTGCDFSGAGGAAAAAAAGAAACQTGDCGGRLECGGTGATPPATLFEVTLGKVGGGAGAGDLDYYDELQVDGVDGGGGSGTVACRSACEAFGEEEYCCSGAYATPATCRPTAYSAIFKTACPRAYSYAYDDGTSTFTCSAAAYTIAFCLPPTGGVARISTLTFRRSFAHGLHRSNTSGVTPLISSPSPANGQNGAGGSTPPPAGNNGAGIISYQPPPTEDINGAGSADQPAWMTMPSSASKRMMPSSSAASTRHNQLWSLLLLLPALLLFHFKQELL